MKTRLVIVAAVLIVGSLLTALLIASARDGERRITDACSASQKVYDDFFSYTRFLAKEFHATQAQIDKAFVALREELGPRPTC